MALTGNNTESMIWNYLRSRGLTAEGAAGLMGNLFAESGLNPINLQDSYERLLGYNDASYTMAIDNFRYSNFVNDKAGYGLAQWTFSSRKSKLLNFSRTSKKSIGDLEMQLNFLYNELSSDYSGVLQVLTTTNSLIEASNKVLLDFERPADQGTSVQNQRARYGQVYYNKYSNNTSSRTKGELLVEEAKKHLGKPYKFGADGPNTFDCSGFIKYVYNVAIDYGMTARTAYDQEKLGETPKDFPSAAGTLVFFKDTYNSGRTPNISHVGMMLGDGDLFIHASGSEVQIDSVYGESSRHYWGNHLYGYKRLINSEDTYSNGLSSSGYSSESPIDTITGLAGGLPLSKVNEYAEELQNAINLLDKSNNSYCSLVDLTKGGEFRFYLPESFTESLPVSWDMNANIIGRSTPPVGYNSSGPRSIPLEITLMAGTGYYEGTDHEKVMEKMYKDINFVRSLSYPDYDLSIVQPPSTVLLSCGSNVRLKGVITGVNVTYCKPIDSKNRSMKVILSFSVSQASDEPPGLSDIRANNVRSY